MFFRNRTVWKDQVTALDKNIQLWNLYKLKIQDEKDKKQIERDINVDSQTLASQIFFSFSD